MVPDNGEDGAPFAPSRKEFAALVLLLVFVVVLAEPPPIRPPVMAFLRSQARVLRILRSEFPRGANRRF